MMRMRAVVIVDKATEQNAMLVEKDFHSSLIYQIKRSQAFSDSYNSMICKHRIIATNA